eukprot:12748209-Alexandrium_andersonii.AAC.1
MVDLKDLDAEAIVQALSGEFGVSAEQTRTLCGFIPSYVFRGLYANRRENALAVPADGADDVAAPADALGKVLKNKRRRLSIAVRCAYGS